MSDQRTCTGTLVPVSDENCIAEQKAKQILDERYPDKNLDIHDSYCEALGDASDGQYIVLGDKLYKHSEKTDVDYVDNICVINELPDGTIQYTACFYDGGTYLEEVLEEGFEDRFRPNYELSVIERFVMEVNKRAEQKMLITHKLEGSHHAAMKQIVDELKRGGKLSG